MTGWFFQLTGWQLDWMVTGCAVDWMKNDWMTGLYWIDPVKAVIHTWVLQFKQKKMNKLNQNSLKQKTINTNTIFLVI